MYDLVLQNARIIDGTGAPWYYGDLAVKDGKIALEIPAKKILTVELA